MRPRAPHLAIRYLAISLPLSLTIGCGGGLPSGGETPPPADDILPRPVPDPCEPSTPCESALMGSYVVVSTRNDDDITTVVQDENEEEIYFNWVLDGASVSLYVTFPGQATAGPLVLESGPRSLGRANIVSALLLGVDIIPQGSAKTITNALQQGASGNHAGCDFIDDYADFSCSEIGGCCDRHDVCIDSHCQPPYGDLGKCLGPLFSFECLTECLPQHCPALDFWSPSCPQCRSACLPCSDGCVDCHLSVLSCMGNETPGKSKCCAKGDCGRLQCCIKNDEVITGPYGVCDPLPDACVGDPTFIQSSYTGAQHGNAQDGPPGDLVAHLSVPYDESLVRAHVPVFGLAYGKDFSGYSVEYGAGRQPTEWVTIATSTTPQMQSVTAADLDDSFDITINGNLATWDTGLTSYIYLPSHPEGHPIDLKGTYTIRLVVTGNSGQTAEDRVTVHVADVIPNAWGGRVASPDRLVELSVPEQALMYAFRLISIERSEGCLSGLPPGAQAIGGAYEVREPGERFTKDAVLRLALPENAQEESVAERVGIYGYDPQDKRWVYLRSTRLAGSSSILTRVRELYPRYALMRSEPFGEGSTLEPSDLATQVEPPPSAADGGHDLVRSTFEDGLGEWANRDADVGADVAIDNTATFDGTGCLKITNSRGGGNFAVNVRTTPFDVQEYSVVQFDYRIGSDVKTSFLVKVSGRWYDIGFTDDPKDLKYRRVNIAHLSDIPDIRADDQWHTARFDLYEMLRTATGNTVVDAMVMADWDVGGYMKLRFGNNRRGANYYIDDFSISRRLSKGQAFDGERILVDDFNRRKDSNSLGGSTAIFTDSAASRMLADFVADDRSGSGHVLELSYDVGGAGGYAGYVSKLGNLDLRGYGILTFLVRCTDADQNFLIGLRDSGGRERKIRASNYLHVGMKGQWQHVTIPLVAFSRDLDWSDLDNLSFAFERSLHGAGSIALDNVEFERAVEQVAVEGFENEDGRNLLGGEGATFAMGNAVASGRRVEESSGGSYEITYGGDIGEVRRGAPEPFSYAGWRTTLRGIDCSRCGNLTFWIRGAKGVEKPNVYLDDGNFRWGVSIGDFGGVSEQWQVVSIPLQEFGRHGVDLTHLAELQIVFEWERMSGTVFVDDIRLGRRRVPSREFVVPGIAFGPRGYEPGLEGSVELANGIRGGLRNLRNAGFRSLVTYGAKGGLGTVPRLAREAGFDGIFIMGIWDPLSVEESARALDQSEFVDGFCLGNEGLGVRYEPKDLSRRMAALRSATRKPVTTSEPIDSYLNGDYQRFLLAESDWVFPIAHPYWAGQSDPPKAVEWIRTRYEQLVGRIGRPVWLKEVGFPTEGDEPCSENSQAEFFRGFSTTTIPFFYFEAFDQPWKGDGQNKVEKYWGLFRSDGTPKLSAGLLEQGGGGE